MMMMMMMMMMMPWGGWPAVAAPVPGWGVRGVYSFAPPPLPGWQPVQHVGQQAPAAQKAGGSLAPVALMTAGPGSGNAKRQRKQVTKKAKQHVLVEAADGEMRMMMLAAAAMMTRWLSKCLLPLVVDHNK
jgi:hypothetical protein